MEIVIIIVKLKRNILVYGRETLFDSTRVHLEFPHYVLFLLICGNAMFCQKKAAKYDEVVCWQNSANCHIAWNSNFVVLKRLNREHCVFFTNWVLNGNKIGGCILVI